MYSVCLLAIILKDRQIAKRKKMATTKIKLEAVSKPSKCASE